MGRRSSQCLFIADLLAVVVVDVGFLCITIVIFIALTRAGAQAFVSSSCVADSAPAAVAGGAATAAAVHDRHGRGCCAL